MVIGWKEYNRYFGSALQEELKRKILQSTYPADSKKSSLYIRRDGLPDIVNIFGAKEKQKSVMVCGPQGSGKSAAVRDSLEGINGVVVATYAHDEGHVEQKLACAITETLGLHTNKQVSHLEVVVNALKEIRSETEYAGLGHPPVLVVEVNKRFMSPTALEELVLTLKDWGHDKALVRPIVVLSTSTAAMGLEIGMDELRAEFATIGDLTDKEAKWYIKQLCRELKLEGAKDDATVSKCAGEVVHALGSRLLHLDSCADKARFYENTNKQVSLKSLVHLAAEHECKILKENRRALKRFHKCFSEAHKKDVYNLFKEPGAAVDVDEFSDIVGEEVTTVLDMLSDIQPHPFYVDPKTQTVVVGSVFVQKVIDSDREKQRSRWFW